MLRVWPANNAVRHHARHWPCCFSHLLLVEGFTHTRDRCAYGLRLGIFAVVSEFAWNYLKAGRPIADVGHNVFFTLLLGYLGLCALQGFEQAAIPRTAIRPAVALTLLCLVSWLFKSDYGIKGFGCILLLYLLRGRVLESAVLTSALLGRPQFILPAFMPVCLYNGKRGFVRGRALQLVFYALYPVHMVVLRLIFNAS